jgi:hypothetical protein
LVALFGNKLDRFLVTDLLDKMKLSVSSFIALGFFAASTAVDAQSCFKMTCDGEYCENMDPPMCTPITGSCGDGGGCLDIFDEPTDCEPMNSKEDTCDEGFFCGETSETCVELSCTNLQKENCPGSLSDGTCNEDGSSGCPAPKFQCSVKPNYRAEICKTESGSSSSSSTTTTTTTTTTTSSSSGSSSSTSAGRLHFANTALAAIGMMVSAGLLLTM